MRASAAASLEAEPVSIEGLGGAPAARAPHGTHKMDAVGRLAGGAAHDFNNLLTSINGYGYLLWESLPEGDERCEFVHEIDKAAQRAATLTQQLLAFGRQEITQSVALDAGRAVRDLERRLRNLVGERIQLGSDLHAIRMDPRQFEQVVVELVVNARDAMPESGRVFVRVRSEHSDDGEVTVPDRTIDLLVTDGVLPGVSGPVPACELAAARPAMKVVFVSGYTDDEALRGGRLAAGQAFLQKPISLEALAARLRDLVDQGDPVPV